ncbi:MAG: amidohydrolase [Chloroflexi bacterium]|nr:amidohydrolase [Chloroflexota bacterium]
MRSIDIHAHIAPRNAFEANKGGEWHGFTVGQTDSGQTSLTRGSSHSVLHPKLLLTPEERLAEMDSMGVDIHVLSTWTQLYNYDLPTEVCVATSEDCNNYVAELVKAWPTRFAGLATLPMQNVEAAIAELERCVTQLGLKGAQINDHVNGRTLGEPEFLPFWQAVERLDAFILFHQVENDTVVNVRTSSYSLSNTIGNLADRTVTYASLVFSGVMDKHPDLKICLAHGGGYTCFGAGRLDRGWQVRSEARVNIQKPPSRYLSDFYYDCLTHSEEALRFMIDTAGADRILLGSDWPFDMGIDSPVEWVNGLKSLTQEEKELILWKNLESMLNI